LLGLGKIDPVAIQERSSSITLSLLFVRAHGLSRAGAMRALATRIATLEPDVLALCQVDDGNALAIATRFDREWAYRGGQALLWGRRFEADRVYDLYLPASPGRPFDRRALLRVDGRADGTPLTLFATQFSNGRDAVRELRFVRAGVRAVRDRALLFVSEPVPARAGFGDLGFETFHEGDLAIGTRGGRIEIVSTHPAGEGLGSSAFARFIA
jgi:hypothetical protein